MVHSEIQQVLIRAYPGYLFKYPVKMKWTHEGNPGQLFHCNFFCEIFLQPFPGFFYGRKPSPFVFFRNNSRFEIIQLKNLFYQLQDNAIQFQTIRIFFNQAIF